MRDTATVPALREALRSRLRTAVGPPLRRPSTASRRGLALHALARGVELAVIGLGYLLLPICPLVASAIARDLSYLRHYPATLRQSVRHIQGMLRGRSIARYLLGAMGQRRSHREQVVGACTHCGNCCLYRGCLFLGYDAHGQSRCRIYGGRVWKLLACGDYPINAEEIDLFACPSFVAAPASPQDRRVIPIATAGFSPVPAPAGDATPVGSAARALGPHPGERR